jgi:capsular polysaccharide biosynthesis protein
LKFSILSIKEEEDGSMSADVDFDDEMAAQIRSHYGVEEITPKVLSAVVKELLEQYVEQQVKQHISDNPDEYHAENVSEEKDG